ncbi:MAG TPA: metal-dependent hydrolase [Methanotrichaceae archaeon]|nr:metal-dependent hydrolase [Methanotrichaceae archaeon]HQF15555.1 metal-dependent hydrolase [Methanotrichaceae archaeon]HQI90291.1 metal-dependent hydrolase [Methanotrichaceae archaeon]HQJ27741.1 metal-dependent hydrolase [Methanotrichaceae archaeon]
MKITWHSHSCFELEDSRRIVIDPYLDNNPAAHAKSVQFNPDLIALTHAHADHLGDAAQIARRTGCLVVAISELARYLDRLGVRTEGMNLGGSLRVGEIVLRMTAALHSAGITQTDPPLCGGHAAGFVIEDGTSVYHAGDTALFSDMKLIGELYRPEVALLPIGGRWTMGPREAALAASWIRPEVAIPMHYNTSSAIAADPAEFQELVETLCNTEVVILEAGDCLEY